MFKEHFKPDRSDFVIIVMGRTGCGKTNFINKLTGNAEHRHAARLQSASENVVPYPVSYQGQRLVLIDTPGFDDTYRPDNEILRLIADWLVQKYQDGTTVKISGIIYVHRISDNRMTGSALKNLQTFSRLCGIAPLPRTRLVTTMWDQMKDQGVARQRETELIADFWRVLIDGGAIAHRFDNTPLSAWDIIMGLLCMRKNDDNLLLQDELVEQHKHLNATEAGRVLQSRLQKLLVERRKIVKELTEQAELQNDPAWIDNLREEYNRVDEQLQKAFEDAREMKIPLSERIILWLCGGQSRAQAFEMV